MSEKRVKLIYERHNGTTGSVEMNLERYGDFDPLLDVGIYLVYAPSMDKALGMEVFSAVSNPETVSQYKASLCVSWIAEDNVEHLLNPQMDWQRFKDSVQSVKFQPHKDVVVELAKEKELTCPTSEKKKSAPTHRLTRSSTFFKQVKTLFKKADELCAASGGQVAILAISPDGNAVTLANPSFDSVVEQLLGQDDSNINDIELGDLEEMKSRLKELVQEVNRIITVRKERKRRKGEIQARHTDEC